MNDPARVRGVIAMPTDKRPPSTARSALPRALVGALLGGVIAFAALREPAPAQAFRQGPGDWFGALLDFSGNLRARTLDLAHAAIGATAGAALGLMAGPTLAAFGPRRPRGPTGDA